MPLYTYVTTYKGAVHIAQSRRSNFKGWPDWFSNLPPNALADLPPALRQKLPYQGDFEPLPNQERVWRKSIAVGDAEITVIAVETRG